MVAIVYRRGHSRDHWRLIHSGPESFPGPRGQAAELQACIYLNGSHSFAQSHLLHAGLYLNNWGTCFVPLVSPKLFSYTFCRGGLCVGHLLLSRILPLPDDGHAAPNAPVWEPRPFKEGGAGKPSLKPPSSTPTFHLDCEPFTSCVQTKSSSIREFSQTSNSAPSYSWFLKGGENDTHFYLIILWLVYKNQANYHQQNVLMHSL